MTVPLKTGNKILCLMSYVFTPQAVPAGISGFMTSFETGSSKKEKLESLKIMSIPSVIHFVAAHEAACYTIP
jgi:hypothetical protein